MEIDDRFLDVDFEKDPNFVFGDLGAPDEGVFGAYEDNFDMLTDSQIEEAVEKRMAEGGGLRRLVTRIFDQKRTSSCTCNAFGQGHQLAQAKAFGMKEVVDVSSMSLYKQITDRDAGSNIGRAFKAATDVGILPLTNAANKSRFEHTMENANWNEKMPSGWQKTAAKLRVHEGYVCKSLIGFKTALVRGNPCIGGRRGHAICSDDLIMEKGKYIFPYANSWTPQWGDGRHGYDSEAYADEASDYIVVLLTGRATPEHLS